MRIKSPDSRNRLLVWVVSLYLCVLMLPWSKKKIHSAQYIAQYCYSQLNTAVAALIFRPFFKTSCTIGNCHFTYTSATQHVAAVHLQVCQKPLRGEIGSLLRCHFEGPNVLATIDLQLQFSRSQEPPGGETGAVQKITNYKKLHGIPDRSTR